MRTKLALAFLRRSFLGLALSLAAAAAPLRGAEDIAARLQTGLFEEEANGNLDAAIEAYLAVVAEVDSQRRHAATAIFRLGECYRKLGRTNDAVAHYRRLLREFSDQGTLIVLCEQNLYALGSAPERVQDSIAVGDVASPAGDAPATPEERMEVHRIRALIQNSPDLINAPVKDGNSPLHNAARTGQLVVAGFLLDNGARVNGRNHAGSTPLFEATGQGHNAMVKLLLDHGADPALSRYSVTPLHHAANLNFTTVMATLMEHGAKVNAVNGQYETPLHTAAANRQQAAAELLLERGADLQAQSRPYNPNLQRSDDKDKAFGTPLHAAAYRSDYNLNIVDALLKRGANANATNAFGETPLHVLAARPFTDSTNVLIRLIEAGSDVNARKAPGLTPLHVMLMQSGGRPSIDCLLHHGADPNLQVLGDAPPFAGMTPLHLALNNPRRDDLVPLLLERGANPSIPFPDGNPPIFHGIALADDVQLTRELLTRGASAAATNATGEPLILWATRTLNPDLVRLLLEHQADPNAVGSARNTSLHLAIELSKNLVSRRMFRPTLLPHNAPMSAGALVTPPSIRYPKISTNADPVELVKTLLQAGAVPNFTNADGLTPLNTMGIPARPESEELRSIAALLKEHGALDAQLNLPADREAIRVWRKESAEWAVVFRRSSHWTNRFTVLDALTVGLAGGPPVYAATSGFDAPGHPLNFPDLSNLRIHRQAADGRYQSETLSLFDAQDNIDCSRNQTLQFGDILEVPERVHSLAEPPVRVSDKQKRQIEACLMGRTELRVEGKSHTLEFYGGFSRCLGNVLALPEARAALKSSSDLARIVVERRNAESGETQTFQVDMSARYDAAEDLRLEDGDVIVVPGKEK